MTISEKIRRIADERGMSQADVARAAGLYDSQVSHIFNEDRNLREPTLIKLCKALDCKAEDIWNA